MKLDMNVLNLLLNKESIRFIAQPDKDGFSKAVVVSPSSHLYSLETVSNFQPCDYVTTNNIVLDGVTKEYRMIMDYLKINQYEAL